MAQKGRTAVGVAHVQAQIGAQAGVAEDALRRDAQAANNVGLGSPGGRRRQREQRAAGHRVGQRAAQAEVRRPVREAHAKYRLLLAGTACMLVGCLVP